MPPPGGRGRARGRGRSQNAAQPGAAAAAAPVQQTPAAPAPAAPAPAAPPVAQVAPPVAQVAPPAVPAPVASRQPGAPPAPASAPALAKAEQAKQVAAMPSGRASHRGGARGEPRPGGQDQELARQMKSMNVEGEKPEQERRKRPVMYGTGLYAEPTTRGSCVDKRGVSGVKLNLRSNYFELQMAPEYVLHHYSVDYAPAIENKKMRVALLKDHCALIGDYHAFDGMQLFTAKKLPNKETEVFSTKRNDGQKVKIRIVWRAQIHHNSGQAMQIYNIIFKRILAMIDCKQIQRHYYCPTLAVDVPQHKLEVWPGYITAIAKHEHKVLLMSDMSHKILRSNTVLDLLYEMFNRSKDKKIFQKEALRQLVGQIVLTRYNNKTYRIDDIDFNQNPTNKFTTESRRFRAEDAGEGPTEISFIEYYAKQHNLKVNDDTQPLLVSKPKKRDIRRGQVEMILLIPELCTMTGLPDNMVADFTVMRDLAKHTRVGPDGRYSTLTKFIERINRQPDVQKELQGWGFKFGKQLIDISGRTLPREDLFCANRQQMQFDGTKAEWDRELRGKRLINPQSLSTWTFIYCGKRDEPNATQFINALTRVGPPMGFNISHPQIVMSNNPTTQGVLHCVRNNHNERTQLICVLLPSNKKDMYDAIKKQCCVDKPVPSQCIVAKTVMKKERVMSVATKVAIQMNMKLGGQAWCASIPMNSFMVIGIDTYHDSAERGRSVAAMVASIDSTATKYFSKVVFQHEREELSSHLCPLMAGALNAYRQFNNNKLPERVFIYRDGVGDGQLDIVFAHEYNQIKRAFDECASGYNPKVAMFVVQKRINTRLFTPVQGVITNPPPGTVVDDVVTRPEHFDFFLVSQSVRQGTVTPTHYVVIHDTSGLKPDHLHKLTYKLCHLYFNWPGTIRVPAPCQYAHKLAFLVGQSLHQEPAVSLCDKLFFL